MSALQTFLPTGRPHTSPSSCPGLINARARFHLWMGWPDASLLESLLPIFHPASTVTFEILCRIMSLFCSKILQQLLLSLIIEFKILTGKRKPSRSCPQFLFLSPLLLLTQFKAHLYSSNTSRTLSLRSWYPLSLCPECSSFSFVHGPSPASLELSAPKGAALPHF